MMRDGMIGFAGAAVVLWGVMCGVAAGAQYTSVSAEMKIAVELEFKEPQQFYDFDGKTLSWREPVAGETHYMMVTLRDVATSAPVMAGSARAAITTPQGKAVGTSITLHETWGGDHVHYGANVSLDEKQTSGNVAVRVEPKKGRRLGRSDGNFFPKAVTMTFREVDFARSVSIPVAEDTTGPVKVEWPEGRRPYVEPTPYPGSVR